jgi:hypothetical protein
LRRPKLRVRDVVLAILLVLCTLAIILRGGVPEKTYTYSQISSSEVRIAVAYFNPGRVGGVTVQTLGIEQDSAYVSLDGPFQAVLLNLPSRYEPKESWAVRWASVRYTVTTNSQLEYQMLLLTMRSNVLVDALGRTFVSHQEIFTDIYRLDAISNTTLSAVAQQPNLENLTLLEPYLAGFSILIVSKGLPHNGFLTFTLDSLELMESYLDPNLEQVIPAQQSLITTMAVMSATVVVPIALFSLVASQLRHGSRKHLGLFLKVLVIYGVVVRLVVAPLTGHPYDMEVWRESTRLFYESGLIDIRAFPLPLTYYFLIPAYAPYALLRILGFQDVTFLAHSTGMMETLFIKAPFMLSDGLAFYILFRIFEKLNRHEKDTSKPLAFALMYFLNPLSIYLSSEWGMYDSIAVALFLAGVYFSFFAGESFLSGLSYVASGLTKGFGFAGLVPLSIVEARERRVLDIVIMVASSLVLTVITYLPLLAMTNGESLSEIILQFLRGRVGFGSNEPFIGGSSYLSYLSWSRFNIEPRYLTYVMAAAVILVSTHYARQFLNCSTDARFELALRYFTIIFLIFYLTFFRVYEQYYLWIIPILIAYSYLKNESAPAFLAFGLGVLPILGSAGKVTVGTDYYYGIPISASEFVAFISVLPSTLAILGAIYLLDSKGPLSMLKTFRGMVAAAGPTLWFVFSLAYYAYYKMPFLQTWWYAISFLIVALAAYFWHRNMNLRRS